MENPIGSFIEGLENWCILFNRFFLLFFTYLKYIFGLTLIIIGIITLMKFRGIYFQEKMKPSPGKNPLTRARFILGSFYVFLGIGIIFNYFTYFLFIVLDPLPDRLIFEFLNFNGNLSTETMNRIEDIEMAIYPHEKIIYYCLSLISFMSFAQIVFCLLLMTKESVNNAHVKNFTLLVTSITEGILAGFTTFLPLFLT